MCACVRACVEGYKALILSQTGQQFGLECFVLCGSPLREFKVSLLTQNNRSECTECAEYMLIYTAQGNGRSG